MTFKVARVVNLKFAFTEWLFYNLIKVMKLHKILYLDLDKALLFSRNQVICLKNWKLWRVPTTVKFNNLNLPLPKLNPPSPGETSFKKPRLIRVNDVYKRVFGIFLIFFRSWVIIKNVKNKCVETRSFLFFTNNSRSKQNKNNSEHAFVDISR